MRELSSCLTSPSEHRLGRVGHIKGLYLDCELNGVGYQALIDTGASLSLVRRGVLPGDHDAPSALWSPTAMQVRTVTGERAPMQGHGQLHLLISSRSLHHGFWLADIQEDCIVGVDLLEKLGAVVDVPRARMHMGSVTIALHQRRTRDTAGGSRTTSTITAAAAERVTVAAVGG